MSYWFYFSGLLYISLVTPQLTFCNESHNLLEESIIFSSGGHPQGKKTIRTQRNWSTSKNSISRFSSCCGILSPLFFLPKEDNKRRQAILRVKSKVNCSQENVNQFYRSATRDMWPLVGKKDARISAQNISVLSIMASWSEWWWHLVSALTALGAFLCAQKTKWDSQC